MWHVILTREMNRSVFYLFLRLWSAAFGSSEGALRAPSAPSSIATVALLYVAGRRLFGVGTGLFASALLAVSPVSAFRMD